MSQRQAAKALGVSQRSIGRDVRRDASKSEAKCLTKAERRAERSTSRLDPRVKDETGKRYGLLRVLCRFGSYVKQNGKSHAATWRVRCRCGNVFVVTGTALRSGQRACRDCGVVLSNKRRAKRRG